MHEVCVEGEREKGRARGRGEDVRPLPDLAGP